MCGRCTRACDANGRCPNLGEFCVNGYCVVDPCCGVSCGAGLRCQGGRCMNPCANTTCAASETCRNGLCVPADCNAPGFQCETGKICRGALCVVDPCVGVTCEQGKFCRDGQCVGSCRAVVCAASEMCVDGQCVAQPCGAACPSGQVCNAATRVCAADACYNRREGCQAGKACKLGQCVDDPCVGVNCPTDAVCRDGQCVDAPPPAPADAGPTAHVDDDGGTVPAFPVDGGEGISQAPGGATNRGGCACDVGMSASSASSLISLLGIGISAAALWVRRRRRVDGR